MHVAEILGKHREEIIAEWVRRLQAEMGPHYENRPKGELYITVAAAFDASYAVLVNHDYSMIDCHIRWITGLRLLGGFSLSEVQGAYEMFRKVATPFLNMKLRKHELLNALERLNECLFYTITRFSDNFQQLHEKQIRNHAQNLEKEVDKRTSELAESEANYRVLVEDINDGYFVNQDGIIVFANKAFCDLHDYTLSEVIGRPYIDFITPESRAEIKKLYQERVEKGYAQDLYVYNRRTRDGRGLPTENKVKLVIYRGERAVAGICRDITERMEMERKVRESESLAHIGQLTTSLAHEIRNPLSSVKMNIQILLKKIEFRGNDKRRMEIMTEEISRLERILTQMLDFAKPLKLDLQPASIKTVIVSCLEMMSVRIQEKGIHVRKKFSRQIPDMLIDRDKIEQAVLNVLQNSVDALPKGGQIGIAARYGLGRGRKVNIAIDDNGPGIAEEDLPYVFDPFFSNKKKGTGLGLWNVKKVVEAHGGMVSIASKKTGGVQSVHDRAPREGTTMRKKILIVDDERSLLESLEMFLSEKDYEVACAMTAADGLKKNNSFKPDVIILDIRLPDMDGLEVLKELRLKAKKNNVIIITAFHDMDTTIKAMKFGACEYIPKPIDIEELERAVERAVKLGMPEPGANAISLDPSLVYEKGKIIGKSRAMKEIFKAIGILSENKVTVLVEGETGTGKEMIARAVHYHSPVKDHPFIAINCSSIVGTLLESELFGHEKGSFTGAIATKKGKFELAGDGTIFLDEVSEIPFELQAKLLRFLQEKEFEHVGGERSLISNARVIAATNRDLWQMVRDGLFREDLYYRLSVAMIRVPPLRERKSDIPLLIQYLLKKINAELHRQHKESGREGDRKAPCVSLARQRARTGERPNQGGDLHPGRGDTR